MSIINALPISDMNLIRKWCKTLEGRDIRDRYEAPMTEVLKYWAEAKENLFHMFGDKLIIEKHISVPRDVNSISHELDDYRVRHTDNPIDSLRRRISMHMPEGMIKIKILGMMDTVALSSNRANCMGQVELKDGRVFKWERKSKCMKVLGKLLADYPEYADDFEEMRQFVSRFTQESTLEGNLCISIHPMDFITASDNDYNWSSCMSYQDGDYHMGTIEMMNSPIVVVAYLKGERPYSYLNLTWDGNKKWRSFFIVTRELMCNIKGYPYQSDTLNLAVLDILKPLYEQYYHTKLHRGDFDGFLCDFGNDHYMSFSMDMMYNDMDTVFHNAYLRNNEEIFVEGEWPQIDGRWEGEKVQSMMSTIECMNCGKTDSQVSVETNSVFCADCDAEVVTCYYCGERIDEDERYWVEDADGPMCCDCFEEKAFIDLLTDCYEFQDKGITLTVIDSREKGASQDSKTVFSALALTDNDYLDGSLGNYFATGPVEVKFSEDNPVVPTEIVYDILTANVSMLHMLGISRPYGYWCSDFYTHFGKYNREQIEELYKFAEINSQLIKDGIDGRSAQGQAQFAAMLAQAAI